MTCEESYPTRKLTIQRLIAARLLSLRHIFEKVLRAEGRKRETAIIPRAQSKSRALVRILARPPRPPPPTPARPLPRGWLNACAHTRQAHRFFTSLAILPRRPTIPIHAHTRSLPLHTRARHGPSQDRDQAHQGRPQQVCLTFPPCHARILTRSSSHQVGHLPQAQGRLVQEGA